MLRRHWLVGIFCASLAPSIGCQGHFDSSNTNEANPTSPLPNSPATPETGTGGTAAGSSGAAGAATGGATGGQSGGTTGTGGRATGGATGGQSGGTTGTGGRATGGATGGQSGGTTGTGGAVTTGTGGSPPTTCGNGKVEPGEACDGSALQSATCAQLGFASGSLACSSTCQFDVSSCTGGTITPTVTASRTSCAAPCAVWFSGTTTSGLSGNDYVAANWNWDFNDPASPHKTTIGFNVAHVFDSPGTYHVTTRVRDIAGRDGTTSTTITVSAMSGTTRYVATSGSDSNNGLSTTAPFRTISHGLSVSKTNDTLLIRRGDSFTVAGADVSYNIPGPFLYGSYSDPQAPSSVNPVLTSSSGSSFGMNGNDNRMTDITMNGAGATSNGMFFGTVSNSLIERVEWTGTLNIIWYVGNHATNSFIVDSYAHDMNGYGVYSEVPQNISVIGTRLLRYKGADHGIRLQAGDNTSAPGVGSYIAENDVEPLPGGGAFDSTAIRGNIQDIVEVNNTFTATTSFTPENNVVVEHILNGLYEGNLQAVPDGVTGLNIIAQHIVVRNNVFVNSATPVSISGHPLLPADYVTNMIVQNNTAYTNTVAALGASYNFVGLDYLSPSTGTVTVQNNIWHQTGTNCKNAFIHGGSEKITADHNLGYAPGCSSTWTGAPTGTGSVIGNPLFVSTTLGAATGFRLQSGSPARNAGASVPVYQDQANVARGAPDVGAYEYTP